MKVEIGALRDCLSLDLQEQISNIIDKKQNDDNYFIVVFSDFDVLDLSRINTKIFIVPETHPLPMMIGTFCVHVDNKAGRIKPIWDLPLDIPTFGLTDNGKTNEEVAESGKRMGFAIFNS